jgi:transposase
MEQLVSGSPRSFGSLLRTSRHRALLSQEQLAARAEVSERTVRNLEADRVQQPRADTARLLAGALQLGGPERESFFAAARGMDHQQATPEASRPVRPPNDAPAQLPLTARGFGPGNNRWRHRSSMGEDKAEIIELCPRGDGPAGRLTKKRDPTTTAFQAWLDLARRDAGICHDSGLTSAGRPEMADLRWENRRLREEVEILTRAVAILASATWGCLPVNRGAPGWQAQRRPGMGPDSQASGSRTALSAGQGYEALLHRPAAQR